MTKTKNRCLGTVDFEHGWPHFAHPYCRLPRVACPRNGTIVVGGGHFCSAHAKRFDRILADYKNRAEWQAKPMRYWKCVVALGDPPELRYDIIASKTYDGAVHEMMMNLRRRHNLPVTEVTGPEYAAHKQSIARRNESERRANIKTRREAQEQFEVIDAFARLD